MDKTEEETEETENSKFEKGCSKHISFIQNQVVTTEIAVIHPL